MVSGGMNFGVCMEGIGERMSRTSSCFRLANEYGNLFVKNSYLYIPWFYEAALI